MGDRERNLQTIIDTGIVAVIRGQNPCELLNAIRAIEAGGVEAIEITMTVPGAIDIIREVSSQLRGQVVVGVGTVLDAATARLAILAGADFVVSPVYRQEIVAMAKRYSKLVIPGGFTPTEILAAWEAGADAVKVFPATELGPEFFKDMHGPFPEVRLTPTGGVNLDNVGEFIKAGACFVGVGTSLADEAMISQGRWADLTARANRFVEAVQNARSLER